MTDRRGRPIMDGSIAIDSAGPFRVGVAPGRSLRFGDGDYPLFRSPAASEVSAPDDCLGFLRQLHLSLLDVFDMAARRWIGDYFDAVAAVADEARDTLAIPAGNEGMANAHRVWCYAAYRPLLHASLALDGARIQAPILFWLAGAPVRIDPAHDAIDPQLLGYLAGVAAPHHPFVRRPFDGLRG